MTRIIVALLSLPLLVQFGCAAALKDRFQSRVMPSVDPADVFQQGAVIMRREFGRVALDHQSKAIIAQPRRYSDARDSGLAGGLVGAPSTLRRSGILRFRRRGDSTVAEVRVEIEREDTHRQTLFFQASRLTDLPSYAPIQRDVAITAHQNIIWTLVRRDRRLERAVLNELRDWAASRTRAIEDIAAEPPPP